MNPIPVNDEPEQYSVHETHGGDEVRAVPIAPGNELDKWVFAVREGAGLVLKKHIGGEKYHASHTVPDAVPHVVLRVLRENGYRLAVPTEYYEWVPTDRPMSYGDHGVQVPVAADGERLWDELSDHSEQTARDALADD
jgi:hypothetical protein